MSDKLHKQYLQEFREAYSVLLLKAHQLDSLFSMEAGEHRSHDEQFKLIIKAVAESFRIESSLLLVKKRREEFNIPRFFAMALMRELLPVSHAQIGSHFRRDAGCSRNACRRVHETLRLKPLIDAHYNRLRMTLSRDLELAQRKSA